LALRARSLGEHISRFSLPFKNQNFLKLPENRADITLGIPLTDYADLRDRPQIDAQEEDIE
jgi:hypothetical protein